MELFYENDEGLSGLHGLHVWRQLRHERVLERIRAAGNDPLLHVRACLNALCSGDGGTDYVLQGLGECVARYEH